MKNVKNGIFQNFTENISTLRYMFENSEVLAKKLKHYEKDESRLKEDIEAIVIEFASYETDSGNVVNDLNELSENISKIQFTSSKDIFICLCGYLEYNSYYQDYDLISDCVLLLKKKVFLLNNIRNKKKILTKVITTKELSNERKISPELVLTIFLIILVVANIVITSKS